MCFLHSLFLKWLTYSTITVKICYNFIHAEFYGKLNKGYNFEQPWNFFNHMLIEFFVFSDITRTCFTFLALTKYCLSQFEFTGKA